MVSVQYQEKFYASHEIMQSRKMSSSRVSRIRVVVKLTMFQVVWKGLLELRLLAAERRELGTIEQHNFGIRHLLHISMC